MPVKVAVLGAGYWGTKLAREYVAIESTTGEASLDWVVDSSEAALESIRRQVVRTGWSASETRTKFGNRMEQALGSDADAVHIALPNDLHFESAKAALEAGKHVLLEKPMATNSRDAFKLAALAEEKGLVLQVGHVFRFNNAVNMVRKLLSEGRLGKIYYAKLDWATFLAPPAGRDIVFDLAPHPIDVLNYLLGEWPSGVDAVGESYLRKADLSEEMAFVNLEYPDEVVANVYLSWIQHGSKDRIIRVIGEKGTIYCDAIQQTVCMYTDEGKTEIPRSLFPPSRLCNGHSESGVTPASEPNNTIRDMEYHFIDTIRGRGPQLNSATIGARNIEVLEAITGAMRRRRAVRVPTAAKMQE
ncbi:MAG: Gfo/Idh/MocA family oxidoreductase [Nitrososphaerales archaeon]|jgi:predicted dehydrogenase